MDEFGDTLDQAAEQVGGVVSEDAAVEGLEAADVAAAEGLEAVAEAAADGTGAVSKAEGSAFLEGASASKAVDTEGLDAAAEAEASRVATARDAEAEADTVSAAAASVAEGTEVFEAVAEAEAASVVTVSEVDSAEGLEAASASVAAATELDSVEATLEDGAAAGIADAASSLDTASDSEANSDTDASLDGASSAGPVAEKETSAADEWADVRARYEKDELTNDDMDAIADLAISYVRDILRYFGEDHVTIDEYEGDEGELILDVSEGNLAVLIGRHGRTLEALQSVVSSFVSNTLHFHYPVVVDIEGYKTRRREKLESLALSSAARARRQHGQVKLPPMNAYERRIVHLTLVSDDSVSTHSEGEDPQRRVVITYVRA